jgi:hypothetical protein
LDRLAKHCIEVEDAAKKEIRGSNAAGIKNRERFDAIVTGACDQGTWVRLLHPPNEEKLVFRVQLSRTDVERIYRL